MTATRRPRASLPRRRGRIIFQLLAVLLLVGVGPLLLSSRQMTRINQSTIENGILNLHAQVVAGTAENVETFFRQVLESLHGIARTQGLVGLLTEEQRQRLLFHMLESYEYIEGIRVMNLEGQVLSEVLHGGVSGLWSGAGDGDHARALERIAVQETYFGEPFAPDFAEHAYMEIVVPVREEGGRIDGALAALVSLADLQELVTRFHVGDTTQMYLVDAGGRVVAHRNLAFVRSRADFNDLEIVGQYLHAGKTVGTIPFLDREGRRMLGAYDVTATLGWGVIIEELRAEAYQSLTTMRRQTVTWVSVGVLLAVVIGTVFAKRVSDPIRQFAEKSLAIANGDFKVDIDIKARNEIGQLSETFNYMTRRLDLYDRNMRELFLSTIKSLAAAIDAKDPYTRGHSGRVTRFSVAIARKMGLDEKAIERVQIAGLLHDVGKIGIEDRVLLKPEKLTDEEYELIKRHPAMGANIMSPIKQLKDIIPGMRHHHEAFDGTGYPDGLSASEIPLIARIIAVADTFDAMTSERVYQKAMDDDFVIKTLIRLSGTRYDPVVVQAFIRAYPSLRRPAPAPQAQTA